MKNPKKAIAVVGPTASGKSDLAIFLAQRYHSSVISADSRQIYRHMNIGSGKIPGALTENYSTHTPAHKKRFLSHPEKIPHYMIDIVAPTTPYSAGKFVKSTQKIIKNLHTQNQTPIICGGTFFWAQALIENKQFPNIPSNITLRKKYEETETKELIKELEQNDPRRAKTIDKNNRPRLIRALEIIDALGSVPSVKITKKKDIQWLVIAINPEKEILHERIEKRLNQRIKEGMVEEVKTLHKEHNVPWTRLEQFGLEYKYCSQLLQEKISEKDMKEILLKEIKHYAKRQKTWLKKWATTTEIKNVTTTKEALTLAKEYLEK
ncbi:MAG: tRNA (adenosine(37)-N6)-dimethylallyltransferase MiaA [Candidatus Moranbacteria bacterium]|nr:tRNA (adenosine(37)-N6)-dimethylallyltransferase MiaA [Candidatus Moranbacteria bacterium]